MTTPPPSTAAATFSAKIRYMIERPGNKIDVAGLAEVLEQFDEKLSRILKQDGSLVFCDDCACAFRSSRELAQHYVNEHMPR